MQRRFLPWFVVTNLEGTDDDSSDCHALKQINDNIHDHTNSSNNIISQCMCNRTPRPPFLLLNHLSWIISPSSCPTTNAFYQQTCLPRSTVVEAYCCGVLWFKFTSGLLANALYCGNHINMMGNQKSFCMTTVQHLVLDPCFVFPANQLLNGAALTSNKRHECHSAHLSNMNCAHMTSVLSLVVLVCVRECALAVRKPWMCWWARWAALYFVASSALFCSRPVGWWLSTWRGKSKADNIITKAEKVSLWVDTYAVWKNSRCHTRGR